MKIRTGFVSNSSTSSFCIFGAEFELDEFLEGCGINTEGKEEDENYEAIEEAYKLAEDMGLEFFSCGEYTDSVYVGLSWSSIDDTETGKEFKESIKKIIHKKFPKKNCGTYEEAYAS